MAHTSVFLLIIGELVYFNFTTITCRGTTIQRLQNKKILEICT